MKILAIFICVGLMFVGCTYEPPTKPDTWYTNPVAYTDNSDSHPRAKLFQAYLDSAVAEGLPGAVLLIRTPQEGTWVGVAGFADIASRVPWQPSTICRIGSVSKLFASSVILRLADEGLFHLDEPAKSYLPADVVANVENAQKCTIRQLLNHTSGINNYLESLSLVLDGYGSYNYSYLAKRKLAKYAYNKKENPARGKRLASSNSNFLLLEMIAENATGVDSRKLLDSLVIRPQVCRAHFIIQGAGCQMDWRAAMPTFLAMAD